MIQIQSISKVRKYIFADAISILLLNGNQTTHNYTYQQEIVSEINNKEEIPEGNFPITLKFIQQHQRSEPSPMGKYEYGMYHKGYFCGGSNNNLSIITCVDNIVIPSKLQSYVLHWYHMYLFIQEQI